MSGQLTALLAAILWLQATAVPTGNHTCTGVVKHPVNVLVNVTEPVTFRSYTWCLRVPPRCSKYTVQLKDRVKLHVEMHNKTITVCCEGYVEMEGRCVPACPTGADCPFMRCNRTNHCHCTPGYTGLYCNEACPRGLWGKDCKRPCDCPSGYTCHHLTGDCFVDDRPPRRTTTSTTTTTTVRTTTTITTPTTEGTTLETVKTPVFRFPPPPWIESAADSKKTTTRQVKKDEAPPTKGMNVIQEASEATTKKPVLEISLPAFATAQLPNKTIVGRPTNIQLFPPLSNEEKVNKKVIDDSTNFKELKTIEEILMKPILSTIPSKSTEKDTSQSKDGNLKQVGATFSKEITTPIPTSPTSELQNILRLHTITIESPLPINFTHNINNQNNTQILPTDTIIQTPALSAQTESTYIVTTILRNNVTQKATSETETATTPQIFHDTKPVENTFENEIQTQMFATTSIDKHTTESFVQSTTHKNTTSLEPKSSVNPRFIVPSIESQSTTKPTTKINENVNERKPPLSNQHQPTMPVFTNPTKVIHSEEEYSTSKLSSVEELPENIVFKNENTPLSSTLNNKIPFTLVQEFSQPPVTSTSDISIALSSTVPNHENTNSYLVSTSFKPATSKSTIPFPSLINLTTAAPTMSNFFTTPITLTTTAKMKSLSIPTTTIKLPTIAALNTSSPLTFTTIIIPPTIRKIAAATIPTTKFTPSTASPISTPVILALSSVTEPTTLIPLKTDSPTTTKKIMVSPFTVSREISDKENNYYTTKPQIKETEPVTLPVPALVTDIYKDFNPHKKLKTDEAHSSYSGQDKPKKKHEKIKPKNINVKEFSQTKTEKHNETGMEQTTEISLRSILQAETFRNKVITTKSTRPSKIQPAPDFMNANAVTVEKPGIETLSSAPTPSKPNQIWYALKKQNFSNTELKEQDQLDILKEPSENSESILVTTEVNKVMESNTIDYRQSSEEPMKKMMAQEEETNYSLIFNKIKFNMTESIAAGVKLSREESSYIHLPMILVLGIALVTLLLLTLTLWIYLKRRRQLAQPFHPCIMAYAMEEPPPMDCDSYDEAFFCPTFTNNYGVKINRELRELNYDHPRSSQPEPLYAEIFN